LDDNKMKPAVPVVGGGMAGTAPAAPVEPVGSMGSGLGSASVNPPVIEPVEPESVVPPVPAASEPSVMGGPVVGGMPPADGTGGDTV